MRASCRRTHLERDFGLKPLTSIFEAAAGEMELLGDKLGLGGGLGGFRGNC